MRKEKSRDAARSRRSKENHEFYELAKLLPLPAAITSQLDFLDKASIIRLTISFLKLRQFSVNGHPPWAPDFTTLGSVNPYSAQSNQASFFNISEPSESKLSSSEQRQNSLTPSNVAFHPPAPSQIPDSYHQQHLAAPSALGCLVSTPAAGDHSMIEKNFVKTNAASLFDIHQGTHILQSLDGFAFAIGRDGRFLYISETVSMYLGLSQVEMTGSSVFDYTHQQDHEELAQQLGIPYSALVAGQLHGQHNPNASYSAAAATGTDSPPASNHSQYSAASSETLIEEHMNSSGVGGSRKRMKVAQAKAKSKRAAHQIKSELQVEESLGDSGLQHERAKPLSNSNNNDATSSNKCKSNNQSGGQAPLANKGDPLVRQFCIRMKSTLTKRGCQHFKSSGYRVVHVVAHLRSYQSNDHGHLMDPLDDSHQQQQPQPIANDHDNPPTSNGESKSQVATNTKQTKRRKGSKTPASEAATSGESNSITEAKGECKLTQVEVSEQAIGKQKPHQKIIGMVAVAIALPPPSINELRLESDTFVLRLGLDLKVTHVEPKITELLHYPIELLAGRSLYSFVHPADLGQVERCHRDLLRKGQMMSGYYRLLSRSGGYIWIQTCATLICNNNTLNTSLLSAAAQAAAAATGGAVSMPLSSDSPGVSMPPQLQMMSNEGHRHQLSQQTPSSSSSYFSPATPTSNQQQQITPSLVSVSLESQLEQQQQQQQQQEQCVIFVNYMITNVVEQGEILDVCQSKDFMPIMMPCSTPSFASSTLANSNNNNNAYNSPTSSCSSPCLTSFKTGSCLVPPQTTPTHNNNNNIINLSSGSPTSSSIAAVKASRHLLAGRATSDNKHSPKTPRRGSHSATKMARHQQVYSSTDSNGYDQTPPLGASAAAAAALNYSSPYEHGSPMAGVYQQQQSNNHHHHSQHQHQAYLTQQATDGVNLAVSKHHEAATSRPGTWLNHANHHHQQQQQQHNRQSHHQVYGTSSNDQNAVSHQQLSQHNNNNNNHNHNNQSEQYWNMDRSSIYKAATFAAANLATGYSSAAYHHHPSVAAAAAAASGYAAHHHHHHHLGQHHQHAGHHHHHSLGLAATNHPAAAAWDSLAAAGVNASSGSAVDSSNNLVMGGAASHHVEAAAQVAATATAVNPYAHHHHHHHPPWF